MVTPASGGHLASKGASSPEPPPISEHHPSHQPYPRH